MDGVMMIIENIASKTARWVKESNDKDTASYEVLEYGFKLVYNTIAIILISLLYGLAFNLLWSVVASLFSFALLRFFSGGRHVNSSDYCVVISVSLIIFITQVSQYASVTSPYLSLFSFILVLFLAPRNIESQLNIFQDKYFTLKIISLLIILINMFFIQSDIFSVAFFLQSLSLIERRNKIK